MIVPEIFYIFVDPSRIITQHNLQITKQFISAGYGSLGIDSKFDEKYKKGEVDYVPYELKESDLLMLSPYYWSAINDIRIETDAEIVRRERFKFLPSRLSCIYAFGTFEDCEIASERYDWDLNTVKMFKLISNDPYVRIAKVNMEIVSLARDFYKNTSMDWENREYIWIHYWSGNGNIKMAGPSNEVLGLRKMYDSDLLYEYLIEGALKLIE